MDTLNLTQLDLKGSLKNFPVEIVKEMLKNQKIQTGKVDISVFEKYITASNEDGGFHWESTEEGHEYWDKIINYRNIREFIPYQNGAFSNPTKSDLILELEGFPLPLVKFMIKEQELQGNNPCFKIFQMSAIASKIYGGFNWEETSQGKAFWEETIVLAKTGKLIQDLVEIVNKYPEILRKD